MTRTGWIAFRNFRLAVLAAGVASCSQDAAGPGGVAGEGGDPPSPLFVSNSRPAMASLMAPSANTPGQPAFNAARSVSGSATDGNIAYIALQSQTAIGGATASITNTRSGAAVTTTMVDGGFDPVPIPASSGDNVAIVVRNSSGDVVANFNNTVPSRRPPKIVRTSPGRGKTGIPLNKNIEIVFSEPVIESSLASSIRLFRGTQEVSGTTTILQGVTAAVLFKPTSNLEPNTAYELVVTNGVRDLDNDPLDSTSRVPFTTGTSVEAPIASVTIIPDRLSMRVGDQFQAAAVAKDAAGNEVTGHEVRWFADTLPTVSVTSTGLVTARSEGAGRIFAEVDGVTAGMSVFVSNGLLAAASLKVAFDSSSVAAGGTLQIAAVAFDADGNLLPHRPIQWSTTNTSVAVVAPSNQPPTAMDPTWFNGSAPPSLAVYWANISGVANGVARIIATIDGRSDTAVITVGSSLPVVAFDVIPDTTTLWLHESAQFKGSSVNSAGARTPLAATDIQWESSNPNVASIGASGVVDARAAGSASITAHWSTYTATILVTVAQVTFESLSAGGTQLNGHTCAIGTDAATYCWGNNSGGQVGRPTVLGAELEPPASFFTKPITVAPGFAFKKLATGSTYTCGLTASGEAYCWGHNPNGELGSNNTSDSWQPVRVSSDLTFVDIAAGNEHHTCGLASSGRAFCWGLNANGELGVAGMFESHAPVTVSGGINFTSLSVGGHHTCGVTSDGTGYCWGDNLHGQLGVGTIASQTATPLPIAGGLKFAMVTAGEAHSCGILVTGSLLCWGADGFGALGNGTDQGDTFVPAPVTSALKFSAVAAGPVHTCALDVDGHAYCWGANDAGQLGIGIVTPSLFTTPQPVVGGLTFDKLSVRGAHTCARSTAGPWYCWGNNQTGALGAGTSTTSGLPVKVLGQP